MSARAPFFLPGSRQQGSMANGDQAEVTKPQFPAEKGNSTHSDAAVDIGASPMQRGKSTTHDSDNKLPPASNANDGRNIPFNVSGLIRRAQSKPPQRIPVNPANGNNIVRPNTADPTHGIQSFDAHTAAIAAPTPFKASRIAPSLLMSTSNPEISARDVSLFNFKTPALPHVHQNDDLFANNAHIPIEMRTSPHTADESGHPRALNGLGNRSLPGQMQDCSDIEDTVDATNGLGQQQHLNGTKRRNPGSENTGRSEQNHPKRFKENRSTRNNPRVERNEQEHIRSRRVDRVSDYRYPENSTMGPSEMGPSIHALPYTDDPKMEQQDLGIGLDRLLGFDVNALVEERHMEKYEQAVARWRECSIEEWFAGADGVMTKYIKILEFVKDRMNKKMALYASYTKTIEQQGSVLVKREEALSGLQVRLIKESEGILGRSVGNNDM